MSGTTVVHTETLGAGYHRIRFRPDAPFRAQPGQFVMVRVREGVEPLLRRPFSIHRYDEKSSEFEILFRVVGTGTELLTRVRVGDRVDILAPLGRGFGPGRATPLLVGGGIGVAPLLFLAERYLDEGLRPKLLLGGREDRDILCHDDFGCLAIPCALATEDGSLGETGLVTALLQREIESADEREALSVHACGPIPMLAAVARLCAGFGVLCEVSLEAHMACGVGACLGCVVQDVDAENVRVCKEGPVFESTSLWWP
jgi:dihydroorotate dehydrogenase electron transfer subunit